MQRASLSLAFGLAALALGACSPPRPVPVDSPVAPVASVSTVGPVVAVSARPSPSQSPSRDEVPRAEFVVRLAKSICGLTAPCCAATAAAFDASYCEAQVAALGWTESLADGG